ncbi:hypothetical protein AB0436_04970 [Streptomyces sp. NPDC051322]|uniref:hypothetical protein n=1 Tax=Streptomyces sp. NPDC051322 TaxID=3154645 RepID=UPI00344BE176
MDEQEELLSAVHHLAWPGTGDLECDEAGHPTGHVRLALSEDNNLSALQEALSGQYGRPRTSPWAGSRIRP